MNNSKVKEIIKFSLYKNIQNKWFIIFNILTLISIVIMMNWGNISDIIKPQDEIDEYEVAVLDNTNLIFGKFVEKFSGDTGYKITKITENTYTAENIPDDFMVVEIIPDEVEGFKTAIISREGINVSIYNPIKDALFNLRNKLLEEMYGVTKDELKILQSDLSVNRILLSVNADDSATKELIKLFSSALTYMLTIFIFSKMANEIASEKQSKSTEYILTTVSAKEYLFAKIFANIAILIIQGLFLFAYYFIAVAIMNIINMSVTDFNMDTSMFSNVLSKDIVYYILTLIIYNVLNLILLCIIQATLSSKVSSTSEAGNTVSLLVFLMMAAYIATVFVITPYTKVSTLLYVISCLPLLSAYFVPAMMVVGQATTIQIVVSLAILIFSIPILFGWCAKIFKNGILDYTKVKKKVENRKSQQDEQKVFLLKREMREVGFVVGLSIIIYIGVQTILSLLGSLILPTLLGNVLGESELTLILQIVLQVISLGLSSGFMFAYTNKKESSQIQKRELNVKEKTKIVFVSILMIFGLQFVLSLLVYPAIGLDYSTADLFDVNSESSLISKIILIIAIAVTPAIFEELFFRKALIDFSLKYGEKFALMFSAILFGLLHMNLAQGLFAFIIGIIFGVIYLYTKDIKFTILIHFINNGFAALEMILPEGAAMVLGGILLLSLVIGLALFISMLMKKESREKIMGLTKINVSLKSFGDKYKYIFTDFTFDIAILLVALMSILTENMLR